MSDNSPKKEQNRAVEIGSTGQNLDPNLVEVINYIDANYMLYGITSYISRMQPAVLSDPYDVKEDEDWFKSGQVETDSFKGKFVAIWKKQIVGWGETAIEAQRMAQAYHGRDCIPTIAFIQRDIDEDFEWYTSNPPELSQYKDKHVAIFNKQIVGWGETAKEARDMARHKVKDADLLMAFIEPSPDLILSIPYVGRTAEDTL